jgi:hypothetical protein
MTPFEILGAVADLLGILGFLSPIAFYYLIKKNLPLSLGTRNGHYARIRLKFGH